MPKVKIVLEFYDDNDKLQYRLDLEETLKPQPLTRDDLATLAAAYKGPAATEDEEEAIDNMMGLFGRFRGESK